MGSLLFGAAMRSSRQFLTTCVSDHGAQGRRQGNSPRARSVFRARVNQVSLVVEFSFTAVEFGRSDECGGWIFLVHFFVEFPSGLTLSRVHRPSLDRRTSSLSS